MRSGDTPWYVDEAVDLLCRRGTVHLASVSADATPLASVTPFVIHGGALCVFVSALAGHTANLRERRLVSMLITCDEAECEDAFARPRLILSGQAREEARATPRWNAALDRMAARFGDTVGVLRELPDFALFCCGAQRGQMVSGFARAHALDADDVSVILERAEAASCG